MSRVKENFPEFFLENVKKPLLTSVPLHDYSNFKIGGTADFFFEAASNKELVDAVICVREASVPYYIIGGGYNLLFDDSGFRGLIIKNGVKGMQKKEGIPEVEVFAGASLGDLLRFCEEQGLGGLEFAAGIPGTLGGAVFGNAGAFEQSIGDFLKEALLLDAKGRQVQVERDYFEFRYRHSFLKEKHDVLLSAVFELREEEGKTIKALIDGNLEKREKKHPPHDLPCAGSYFKNPVLSSGE
ncbi:UDP-N-acetylmuramate dehydrogenase, partial [bacterium]|nr:UDP-N-acetylmuramate dehydrogenase [bacterium]